MQIEMDGDTFDYSDNLVSTLKIQWQLMAWHGATRAFWGQWKPLLDTLIGCRHPSVGGVWPPGACFSGARPCSRWEAEARGEVDEVDPPQGASACCWRNLASMPTANRTKTNSATNCRQFQAAKVAWLAGKQNNTSLLCSNFHPAARRRPAD